MSLRGTASSVNLATGNTCVINVGRIGIQADDLVLLFCTIGGGVGSTFSCPGFTVEPNSPRTGAGGGGEAACLTKIAGQSEPPTYTVSATTSDFFTVQARVYSGRSGVITTSASYAIVSGLATPTDLSTVSGLTAAAGDDVAFIGWVLGGSAGMGTITYTPSAGYGDGVVSYIDISTFTQGVIASDLLNVAGGGIGTIGGSVAWSNFPTQNQIKVATYIVSLAKSATLKDPVTDMGPNVVRRRIASGRSMFLDTREW